MSFNKFLLDVLRDDDACATFELKLEIYDYHFLIKKSIFSIKKCTKFIWKRGNNLKETSH